MTRLTLGETCEKIGSGATPRGGKSVYLDTGIALVRSQNVYNEGFSHDGLVHISDEDAKKLSSVQIQCNDNLLNITGDSVARTCQAPEEILPARVNQHVAIVRANPGILNPRFLHYVLVSPEVQRYLLNLAGSGATRKALTKEMIESLEIEVPPLPIQLKIADSLGFLDDKILLNKKIGRTCESIAQTLFKSWFVDFDPVRAKAEGKKPFCMDDETAALFPDSFEDSELGGIPEGWRIPRFSDWVSINKDSLVPSEHPDELFHYYSIPAFDASHMPSIEKGIDIKSMKHVVTDEMVLLSKLNPRIPRIWHPAKHVDMISVGSTEFLPMIAKEPLTLEFLYYLVSSSRFLEWLTSLVTGTSGSHQRVRVSDLSSIRFVLPPETLLIRFTELVSPIMKMMELQAMNAATLGEIRDLLLPKLVSSEIRIDGGRAMGSNGDKAGVE